ncbi:uroplakin-3a [Eleutherodactylus coqui]|uniref:Uncharacterized protein n=1 Tax=Eleutherodactylus coqui TaxID=57060 RepID=A0A8J6FR77_ELECQ|nr:hypothetical protein GDO78_006569 [Eleutherodactylus coqui]
MGAGRYLLAALLALLHYDLARGVAPLLCSSTICAINPTLNTIILEKPYCFYTSSSPVTVALYVARNSAESNKLELTNTYYTTDRGRSAPYVAATFKNPVCAGDPTTADIGEYVYRVGDNENCFNLKFCNGPLLNNTAYRFLYAFYDTSNVLLYQSSWSAPITTKQGKNPSSIDTWPGARSGGMIVLTSILSVLMFLLLAGLVAAVITSLMTQTKELEPTRHESRSTHVPQKSEGAAPSLSGSERYSTNPQP